MVSQTQTHIEENKGFGDQAWPLYVLYIQG